MYNYTATVLAVVDGDTLDLNIDLGLETYRKIRVRLNGLDCPEKNTPEGKAAKAFTEQWVKDHGPTFEVYTIKDKTEKYGRHLAEVYGGLKPFSLNSELLITGHAKPTDPIWVTNYVDENRKFGERQR